jgi:hypothetical protein
MRQQRTCKKCGYKQDSSLLSHKGNSVFHCKDPIACATRSSALAVNEPTRESNVRIPVRLRGYVVTSVVNGIPIAPKVLESLEGYCADKGYQLIVMGIDYAYSSGADEVGDKVNPRVVDYLLTDELVLNNKVRLLGNLQLSPTAENPLTGLNPLTRGLTTIVPHTQLALESIANSPSERAIFLYSTGAITQAIYSDTKAGHKAKFHHSISGLVVEFDSDNNFYIRTLPIDKNANIFDLGYCYPASGKVSPAISNLVLGDSHVGYVDKDNDQAIRKLIENLPLKESLVLHDVFDGSSINHHELDNPVANPRNFSSLSDEYKEVANYINSFVSDFSEVLIVDSNHHDFIAKWVLAADWKKLKGNHSNQVEYLEAALALTKGCSNLLEEAIEMHLHYSVQFLSSDEPYFIEGIDVSQHGHLGSGGARGSAVTFNKLGYKTVTGHTHSARINKSNYTNGTSSELQLPYMKGLSSHSHTHTLIYDGGKRQMFTTYKGKYKA